MKKKYPTTKEIVDHYITYRESIRRTMQPETFRVHVRVLEGFLLDFRCSKTHRRADDFHRFDAREYIYKRQGDGIKLSTLKSELGILRAFWNWMMERELASYNPFSGIDLTAKSEESGGMEV